MRSPRAASLVAGMLALVTSAASEAPPVPRLVVIVSIDGLSWSRLDSYRPWYVAGLKRLLAEGRVATACRYRHLNTETGPGHAALSTGAPPRVTGIVANSWFEQRPDGSIRSVNCVDQAVPDAKPGQPPVMTGPGNLRVPTLGDRLVESRPAARVVSLSAKARSAIFLAGRDARHATYWFDQDSGNFVTSAAYEPPAAARSIVAGFNRTRAGPQLPARFGLLWKRLPEPADPAPVARPTPVPDLFDYQLSSNGIGFDHPLTLEPRGYFAALYVSPFIDELLADLALAFVEDDGFKLGRADAPDLLALSFSAQDVVSHSYGNESEETLDVLRRLDRQLGRVLDALDRKYPRGGVALALSADHGFEPIPEAVRARDKSFHGGRLVYSDRTQPNFLERLNRALAERLCLAPGSRPIYGAKENWNLIYDRPRLPLATASGECGEAGRAVAAADIDQALPKAVAGLFQEEIAEVLLVSRRDQWPASDPAVEFARNDLDLERSGDAFLVPRPNVLMHWDPGRGSGHGSQYESDTHVPLIFWGGAFAAGTLADDATPYDLAPTLAGVVGLKMPEATGRDLRR